MIQEPTLIPTQELAPHHKDELTGYANRAWLNENLPRFMEENPNSCGVLFLDLDGLKAVNDKNGHAAGDQLIIEAADTLNDSVRHADAERTGDTVGHLIRLGGDELVVVLTGVKTDDDLQIVKDRINKNLALKGISASMGGAINTDDQETSHELLKRADKAMYEEKTALKERKFNSLNRRKQFAAKLGERLIGWAGVNPPRQ